MKDMVLKDPAQTNKWQQTMEISSLVLGGVLTVIQIYVTQQNNKAKQA